MRKSHPRLSRREVGVILVGFAFGAALSWMVIFSGWQTGSKAEWFAGIGSFAAVAVALWQSLIIRKQADADAIAATQRLEDELRAAEARSAAELTAQKELARVERVYRREQEIKAALVAVARSVSEYGTEIAGFWIESVAIAKLPTQQEREEAFFPVSRKLGVAVSRIAGDCDAADIIIDQPELEEALAELRNAAEVTVWATDTLRQQVERDDNNDRPNIRPVHKAQARMVAQAADTRRIAWDLLRTGMEDG